MFIRKFHVSCPVTNDGREGRVAFDLLRHGAFVLALPKTRVVKTSPRANDSLLHSHPASFTRPPRRLPVRQCRRSWQPFNLSPSTRFVKGRRPGSFSLSAPPCFFQRLQSKPLSRLGQGGEFQFLLRRPAARPFKRQPYKLSALSTLVNPGPDRLVTPGDRFRRARGPNYKRLFPARQPSRGFRRPPTSVAAGEVRREGKSGPPRWSRGGPLLRKG